MLTVGSSKVFQFKGGPLPWIHEHSSHKISLGESLSDYLYQPVNGPSGQSEFSNMHRADHQTDQMAYIPMGLYSSVRILTGDGRNQFRNLIFDQTKISKTEVLSLVISQS